MSPEAGISVCCGGILGMGETLDDRIDLLCTLANLDPQPESVPINALVPIEGAPLCDQPPLDVFEWLRAIAVARVLMPKSMVRLSAGRLSLSREAQALAFLAGANAIFVGDKLLTTANPGMSDGSAIAGRARPDPVAAKPDNAPWISSPKPSGAWRTPGVCDG